ncbi:S1/P1 nuclease [Singulisphaera sp. PoT]|uniref:S1/P1 nuclease n=1 Tax=Singulisphaera sp. PoT TaxID=3411797 RepID=UPI003BF56CC6
MRLALALSLIFATPCFGWNYTGHKVIASIAYRQLDAQTRQKIADLLKKHPAYAELWAAHQGDGADANLNLFWDASVFPDDANRGPFEQFGRPRAHYVNYRILADKANAVEPPLQGENILNSYVAHVRLASKLMTPDEDKALHVSWIIHQAGDIHQPLHAVARFSKPLPNGDRGGNDVTFPNPRGMRTNLHAYWDDLLGRVDDPVAVEELTDGIIAEYPTAGFAKELSQKNIKNWAEESVSLSLSTVYRNLDPALKSFADLPVGYDADATRLARKRVALAGYRLGQELKAIFGPTE